MPDEPTSLTWRMGDGDKQISCEVSFSRWEMGGGGWVKGFKEERLFGNESDKQVFSSFHV